MDEATDIILDEVFTLLSECRFAPKRTREKAEQAIIKLESLRQVFSDPFHSMARGLVVYPDLLSRYLQLVPLDDHDLVSMVCRCLECRSFKSQHEASLSFLLENLKGRTDLPSLLLLPGKYPLDEEMYRKCCAIGLRDPHFDGTTQEYNHNLNVAEASYYIGYREIYHACLYAGPKCQVLIPYWDRYGADCTTEGAMDYLQITYDKDYPTKYKEYQSSLRQEIIDRMKVKGLM